MTIDVLAGLAAGAAGTTAAVEPGPIHASLPVVDAVRRDLLEYDPARMGKKAGVFLGQELMSVVGKAPGPYATFPDGEKGPDTTGKLRAFQRAQSLPVTGEFDRATHAALVRPILAACELPTGAQGPRAAVVAAANRHAAYSAREIAPNSGPWVRTYMAGNQGSAWAWCAGFASFVWIQAAIAQGEAAFEKARRYRTFGCDEIANRAKADGLFVEGADVVAGRAAVLPGDLFLVQARERDWVHVGVITAVRDGGRRIATVEGNTNAGGSREGLYVMARERAVAGGRASGIDFVRCPFAPALTARP